MSIRVQQEMSLMQLPFHGHHDSGIIPHKIGDNDRGFFIFKLHNFAIDKQEKVQKLLLP